MARILSEAARSEQMHAAVPIPSKLQARTPLAVINGIYVAMSIPVRRLTSSIE
jgi:hypothetical protein